MMSSSATAVRVRSLREEDRIRFVRDQDAS